MKSCKEELRERIQEYIPHYNYEQGSDMAAIIFQLIENQLLQQQHKIQQLPYQKQNELWNICKVKDQEMVHPEIRMQLFGEEDTHIPEGTIWLGEDQDGNEVEYEQRDAFDLQQSSICAMFNVDGKTQTILPQKLEHQDCILHKGLEGIGAECNALCFTIPHFFDHVRQVEFDLYLECDEELLEWLCDASRIKITLGCKHHQSLVSDITPIEQGIHIRYEQKEHELIEELWFYAVDASALHPVYIRDARFFWSGKQRRCDVVLGEDRIFTEDEIPMFDSPMELYAACYIGANEVLRHKGANITLYFETFTRCLDQGMELLQKQPYKAVMRKLPLELPVYDAYADHVLLEYFNGSSWCMIEQTQGIQKAFQKEKKTLVQVSFICPKDMTPTEVMGTVGYYIRFRLTHSNHLYQQPCHMHIPYLTHIRFSYEQKQGQHAERVQMYSQLSVYDITSDLGNQGYMLFSRFPIKQKALLIGFDQLKGNQAMHLMVKILESNATGSPISVSYASKDGTFHKQHIEDHTDGFSQSGELILWVSEEASCISLFDIQAYWICIEYQDGTLPDASFQLAKNTLLLHHKTGSMIDPIDLHPSEPYPVVCEIFEGPYGVQGTESIEQKRLRAAHQYFLRNRAVSERDIKHLVMDEVQELYDLALLKGKTHLNEFSRDTHIIVLFNDLRYHHSLFVRNISKLQKCFRELSPLCIGEFIIEEPLFVDIQIELHGELLFGSIWEETQFITQKLDNLLQHPWKIDERISPDEILSFCQNQLPHIRVEQLMIHASYSDRGTTTTCLWEDLPILHGICLVLKPYQLQLHEKRSGLC